MNASSYYWKQGKNFKKYEELWLKIRNLIRLITRNSDGYDYDEKYIKIKFNSDDELPLNKAIEISIITIIVRAIFLENYNYYSQFFMDDCTKYKWKVTMN